MIQHEGLFWPDDVGEKWQHALMHVKSVEWAIAHCNRRRTAVQAGGNVGLWPRRLAESFQRVITFEPDARSRECLLLNVPPSVEVHAAALADEPGQCSMIHKSLGSHRVYFTGDNEIPMETVDSLELDDLDFLQLDIEGYEWHALNGAKKTVDRCHPMIQIEFRHHTNKYGQSDESVRALLATWGYQMLSKQQGSDEVFGVPA